MKPVATKPEFKRAVNEQCKYMGLGPPWSFKMDLETRDIPDPEAYAACIAQPDYFYATLYFDPTHPGWAKEDFTITECVRHELFHAYISAYTHAAHRLCGGDKQLEAELNAREEELVTRLATMPIWEYNIV